ncbi:Piso0_004249 [Millerozyma farinosa CBS 7064]|uniref:Piso0_004249 protein n=1 Tax=Pichia sorbitophila (strain ATCC MYA-4447 / BCRC 22081 / CBS 7064 / NBRC 10061 / NRRL Y-12695) TaxID=559304 RepID=G8YB00_PICSO|nr:Piso0_004249 [Millerozyma farinosa CBS 7064]CCE84695.1 Piso0_004249 [Millerozyma farinosa CBS 7064]
MFGGPGGPSGEDQKKLQEQYAYDTLKLAGVVAGVLWVSPIVFHFIKRQF